MIVGFPILVITVGCGKWRARNANVPCQLGSDSISRTSSICRTLYTKQHNQCFQSHVFILPVCFVLRLYVKYLFLHLCYCYIGNDKNLSSIYRTIYHMLLNKLTEIAGIQLHILFFDTIIMSMTSQKNRHRSLSVSAAVRPISNYVGHFLMTTN